MKTIMLRAIVYLMLFGATMCSAQSNVVHQFAGVGPENQSVELSIASDTSVVTNGSSFSIFAEVKNMSTNEVQLSGASPEEAFVVTLINESGNEYRLTHNSPLILRPLSLKPLNLNSGESHEWTIHITLEHQYATGHYTIKATRYFNTSSNVYRLESNLLNFEILR